MIIQTVNEYDFTRAFETSGRSDNFSYAGLRGLFEYLDNLSDDIGENIELDVIAICCEYSEMTIQEVLDYYDHGLDVGIDNDQLVDDVMEYLNYNTVVCWYDDAATLDSTVIFAAF